MSHHIQTARKGRKLSISLPRRFVIDLLHFAKKVPSVPMERRMDLSPLIKARECCLDRIGWCAIFLKSFAILSQRHPEFRRAYMQHFYPFFYEHPGTIASFSLEREYEGEKAVFFARVPHPETIPIREIANFVRHCKLAPIHSIDSYRAGLLLSRFPKPLRRLFWWLSLNTNGAARSERFGTFAISVVASFGASGLHLLSPLTATLNYGVFAPDGTIDVRIAYDHRVLDGGLVARAIVELEEILNTTMAEELREDALQVSLARQAA